MNEVTKDDNSAAAPPGSAKYAERLSRLVEENPAIIWAFDEVNGRMVYLNKAITTALSYDVKEFYSHPMLWLELIHPDDRAYVAALNLALRTEKKTIVYRDRFRHAEGHYVELATVVKPVCDAKGNIVRTEGAAVWFPPPEDQPA